MSERPKILVVDDEPAVRQALSRAFALELYVVAVASDGGEALEALASERFDAIVLDVMMPGVSGLEVCRRLRRAGSRVPILILKPFALRELMARMRALLRRRDDDGTDNAPALAFEDLALDSIAHEVHRGERRLELTRTEFALLELFMRHPRHVLSRSTIFEHVWGYDFGAASNTLGVYMGYLRRKTEEGGAPRLLHTVRGVGYILRAP